MGLLLPLVMTFFSPSFRSSYTNKYSSYEFQMVDGNLGMGNRNKAKILFWSLHFSVTVNLVPTF